MASNIQRMGHVIAVRPEKIAEYKKLHADAWFSHWEYTGADFAGDMARMATHEPTRQWWALTDPCQQPLASAPAGEKWSPLEEVFYAE